MAPREVASIELDTSPVNRPAGTGCLHLSHESRGFVVILDADGTIAYANLEALRDPRRFDRRRRRVKHLQLCPCSGPSAGHRHLPPPVQYAGRCRHADRPVRIEEYRVDPGCRRPDLQPPPPLHSARNCHARTRCHRTQSVSCRSLQKFGTRSWRWWRRCCSAMTQAGPAITRRLPPWPRP